VMKVGKQKGVHRTSLTGGMTMVEVIAASAVLILIMGMFAKSLTMANQMFRRSEKMLEDSRNLVKGYYLEDEAVSINAMEESLVFTEREDGGEFSIAVELREFTNDMGTLYDVVPVEKIGDSESGIALWEEEPLE